MTRHLSSLIVLICALFAGHAGCDDSSPSGSGDDPARPPGHGTPGGAASGGEAGGSTEGEREPGGGPGGESGGGGGLEGLPESCGGSLPIPGLKTLHRLNRAEYDNTVRDLLGDSSHPARDFPADDHGHGFDNQANVLSVGPLLAEKYAIAAQRLVEDALFVARTDPDVFEFEAEDVGAEVGAAYRGFGWNIWSNGDMHMEVAFVDAGDYRISIRAFGQQAGPEPVRMHFSLDNAPVEEFVVEATEEAPETYVSEFEASAGPHSITVGFLNDFYEPENGLDRNLIVDWVEVRGPLTPAAAPNPEARTRILVCDPADSDETDCAREIFARFGRRAWRRPLTPEELARLARFLDVADDNGGGWEDGIRLGLHALLLSPNFLFRVEIDPDPTDETPHEVSDHELAARLSYFLWSSMPDEALDTAADAGGLNDPEALQAQIDRMLKHEKARALVDDFAGQWLFLRALDDLDPDYQKYPDFDEELRSSMHAETAAFFEAFLDSDTSALDMLDAGFSYVDDRLARHYGVPAPGGDGVTRTEELGPGRGGLLSQASVLSVTSHRTRTSPVKRGLWVLANLLCAEPPPPPPEVPQLDDPVDPEASLRERMEQHRADPQCAGCHAFMDPIGFSFEHFDAIGAWRDDDDGFPIDDGGVLPDGQEFRGPSELAAILKQDARVPRCIAGKLSTYGLGRGEDRSRKCAVDKLTQDWGDSGYTLKSLVRGLVLSQDFRMRRGEAEVEGTQ